MIELASTFGSLEVGLRALQTNQLALQVTGQNIANVDTDGYSRQTAVITTTDPYTYPALNSAVSAGQIGTGVEVSEIKRIRDEFIDYQTQKALSAEGEWEAKQSAYEFLEVIFDESSDASVSSYLDQFWESLQELSVNSDDTSVRATVLENASVFTEAIRNTYTQLTDLREDIDGKVQTLVGEVNSLAQQIADLNEVIGRVTAMGQAANDLMDQRELLTQELAGLADITVQTDSTNQYNISIGGSTLVTGKYTSLLTVEENTANNNFVDIVWEQNGASVTLQSGQIAGYLDMRDEEITYYLDSLDEFAATLIEEFNATHAAGYGLDDSTGLDFFSGTGALDIDLSEDIASSPDKIAASVNVAEATETPAGASGNGDNALALADILRSDLVISNGTLTLSQYYNNILSKLGVDAETTYSTFENRTTLVTYLEDQQESIAGVSLDEETTNLIKYQNAYSAASRYITAIDELLDTLINSTGVVGL